MNMIDVLPLSASVRIRRLRGGLLCGVCVQLRGPHLEDGQRHALARVPPGGVLERVRAGGKLHTHLCPQGQQRKVAERIYHLFITLH